MYIINDKKSEEKYSRLMEVIKETNLDWIELRQSKEYRIGMALKRSLLNIKKIKIKDLLDDFRKWTIGLKKDIKYKDKISITNRNEKPNYFSEHKIAIYTCIFGSYDKILEPYYKPDNCDFLIFTDQNIDANSIWKKVETPEEIEKLTNVEKNRFIKMFPHKLLKDYDYTIYIDGNVRVLTDLTEYVNKLNPKIGIGIHKHHLRDCLYDELKAIVKMNKKNKQKANEYKKKMIEVGMPTHYGLLQCNVIVRSSKNKICEEIMQDWWNEFKNNIQRDQVSLPYVLYKHKISVKDVATLGNNIYRNPSFRILTHK